MAELTNAAVRRQIHQDAMLGFEEMIEGFIRRGWLSILVDDEFVLVQNVSAIYSAGGLVLGFMLTS